MRILQACFCFMKMDLIITESTEFVCYEDNEEYFNKDNSTCCGAAVALKQYHLHRFHQYFQVSHQKIDTTEDA